MNDPTVKLGQLAEEFTARLRKGEQPDIAEYASAHPELAERINELFPTLLFLEGMAGSAAESAPGVNDADGSAGTELEPGQRFGAYRIESEVGRGGMGIVYEAIHMPLGKRVALKVLPIRGPQEAGHLERFFREARTAASLHHTNIVPVFDVGQVDGLPYYAMELITGRGLDQVLAELDRDTVGDAPFTCPPFGTSAFFKWLAGIGVQVASALEYAHTRRVIHRDIKPSNLILDNNGVVWITDFGLARRAEDPSLTRSGAMLGTPRYMSPEQARAARRPVDGRTDVYSLGATLYEFLARRPAFDGRTPQEVVHKILEREPLPPRKLNPSVPLDLETIVLKAMSKGKQDRYQSASALSDDLNRWLRTEPIQARRIGPFGRTTRWCRRNPAIAALAALVFLVMSLGIAGVAWQWQKTEAARRDALAEGDKVRSERDAKEAALEEKQAAYDEKQKAFAETQKALGEKQDALADRERAFADERKARRRADGLRLSAQSASALETNPSLALLLALEGAKRSPGLLANNALIEAIDASGTAEIVMHHGAEVKTAVYSPNGERVLTRWWANEAVLWDASSGRRVATLDGHREELWTALFCADGSRIVTASHDGFIQVWDSRSLERISSFREPCLSLTGAVISPDGRRVIAEIVREIGAHSARRNAVVFDTDSGERLFAIEGLPPVQGDYVGTWSAEFSPDSKKIVSAIPWRSYEMHGSIPVQVFDADTGEELLVLRDASDYSFACFSPDGRKILAVKNWTVGEQALLFDAADGRKLGAFDYSKSFNLEAGAFSPDSRFLTIWSGPGSVEEGRMALFDLEGGALITEFHNRSGSIHNVAYSPDSAYVVVTSNDQVIRIFDLATGAIVRTLRGHGGFVYNALYSPDGSRILSCSGDGTARIWNLETWRDRLTFRSHTAPVRSARFSPDGKSILTASDDRTAVIQPILDPGALIVLRGHEREVMNASFSPDGTRVITEGLYETARVWDAQTGEEIWRFQPGQFAQFSPDGQRTITADYRKHTYTVWDAGAGEPVETIATPRNNPVEVPRFSPDGTCVAIATGGGVIVHYFETKRTYTMPSATDLLAFSPDGRILVRGKAGSAPHSFCVWDMKKEEKLRPIQCNWPVSLRFAPGGRKIIAASRDKSAMVWDVETGERLIRLEHPLYVTDALFSHDGTLIATSCADNGVRLFDATVGAELAVLQADAKIRTIAFSPDDQWLLAALDDGSARLWPVDPASFGSSIAARGLTPEERDRFEIGTVPEREARRAAWLAEHPGSKPSRQPLIPLCVFGCKTRNLDSTEAGYPLMPLEMTALGKVRDADWEWEFIDHSDYEFWLVEPDFYRPLTREELANLAIEIEKNSIPGLFLRLRKEIDEDVLAELSGLTELQLLIVNERNLTDRGLAHLSTLTGLRILSLTGTGITDEGLWHLEGLDRIEELNLAQTAVTDAGLGALGRMENLAWLDLRDTAVTGTGLASLKGSDRLQCIGLRGTAVDDQGIESLRGSSIRALDLGATAITDKAMNTLFTLEELRILDLTGTAVGDDGLARLKGHGSIVCLHLERTRVTDAGIGHLAGCPNLTSIVLKRTAVTDRGLASLAGRELQALSVGRTGITDKSVEWIARTTSLINLDLGGTKVTEEGIACLENLTDLTFLSLCDTPLTDESAAMIAGMKDLTALDLSGTGITDETLENLAGLGQLEFLALMDTRVTEKGLAFLRGLENLEFLFLTGTDVSSDATSDIRDLAECVIGPEGNMLE